MEHDAGEGVHHGGEGGDGQDVAGDFDGALFGGALDFLEAPGVGHGADVPDVVENGARVADEKRRKLAIVVPGPGDGGFVEFLAFFIEEERRGRDVGLRAVQTKVALALLFGIIEGMRVEGGPDKLAADGFQAEFGMGVLVDGMMGAVEGGGYAKKEYYFFAAAVLAAASAYFLVKRSTRPAVSINFCLPVKKGWQFEQISTRSVSPLMVERVVKLWPQAQCTVTV